MFMIFKNLKIVALSGFFMLAGNTVLTKNIIWDLGGVLLRTNKLQMAYNIGFSNFAFHAIQDFKIPDIEPKIFDLLSLLNEDEATNSFPKTPKGERIPDIMVDWMLGVITGHQIMLILDEFIESLYKINYFSSYSEKTLIKKTLNAIFDPIVLGENTQIIKEGLKLVKKCSKKHDLFILSNWDHLSFNKIYDLNPKLFTYFKKENIFISGHLNLIKPNHNFYNHLLQTAKLDPKDCVFIDDQEENIIAANKLGITSIWLKDNNYKELKKTLIKHGIITAK